METQKINTENLCRSRIWRHFTALKDPRVKDYNGPQKKDCSKSNVLTN